MNNASLSKVVSATAFSLAVMLSSQANANATQEQAMSSQMIETQSISIPYADRDLATDTGRANLLGKIKRAAKEVCGPTGSREAGGLRFASRNRECYENAMEAAVSQVETGQLASLAS
jgi:UrcA family protein